MPFFSIIIPSYNRYHLLKRAIESVLAQSFKDYKLFVIDDGSTDETNLIQHEYEGLLVYLRQDNSGVSSARNFGIMNSDSPFLTFLDSDDAWLPQKLEEQYKYIQNNPDIPIHQTEEIWIRNGRRVNQMNKHSKQSGNIFIQSLDLCLISPSSVVIRRDLFEKYGLFDEDLPVCEDYDLWLRITCQENVGLIKKKLMIKYGGHKSQLSKSYWGLDRFRVYSILKLLIDKYKDLTPDYLDRSKEVAKKKCEILLNGAAKRNNVDFADTIKRIIKCLDEDNYNKIDFGNLLI